MAGGLAVISDVPKTMIYELARWINSDYAQRAIEVNRPYLAGKVGAIHPNRLGKKSFQNLLSKNRPAPS